jgi:hypothetical protein
MIRKYVLAIAAVIIVSCGPARVVQDYQKDSVVTVIKDTTIFRDSIIYVRVEADKESAIIPDTDTSRLSTRYAESEAYVKDGQLHHSLRNRSEALIPIETKIPITIHFESKSSISDKRAVEVVEVEKQLSRWQKFIQALGYGVLIAVILWIAKKFIRL